MPSFRYQGLGDGGASVSGVVAAPDRASAVRLLRGRGEVPLSLEQVVGDAAAKAVAGAAGAASAFPNDGQAWEFKLPWARERPTLDRPALASLMRELATAIEAGLPLMSALRTVRKQAGKGGLAVILDHMIERVEAGAPLHQAAEEYGPPFDDMIVGMLRAADASGRMAEILHQLSDLLERSVELRRDVMGATIYPMIVAGLLVISIIFLVTVVVPRLMDPLLSQPGLDASIPWPTALLLGLAEATERWWIWVVIGLIGLVFAWRYWVRIPANRLLFHRALLRLPLVGTLLRDVAVARFTRTLGTLVSAGLPILQSLRIVRDTLGNEALMNAIDQVQEKVTTGQSIAEPLERSGYFPPLLIQIVNIGERSGRLESMLLHAADAFDRQVNMSLKVFSKSLPPVLLMLMAPIVVFVLMAIILPLLELQRAVGG